MLMNRLLTNEFKHYLRRILWYNRIGDIRPRILGFRNFDNYLCHITRVIVTEYARIYGKIHTTQESLLTFSIVLHKVCNETGTEFGRSLQHRPLLKMVGTSRQFAFKVRDSSPDIISLFEKDFFKKYISQKWWKCVSPTAFSGFKTICDYDITFEVTFSFALAGWVKKSLVWVE